MVGRNAQDVALAGLSQHGFDVARSIHAIRCNEGERHLGCDRLRDHLPCKLRLRREAHVLGNLRRLHPGGSVRPLLRQVKSAIDGG